MINIRELRTLARDAKFRRETGKMLCEGQKLYEEATAAGVEIIDFTDDKTAAERISTQKSVTLPVFTVPIPDTSLKNPQRAVILDALQDPGNVGAIIRTAAAMGLDTVIFSGDCADFTSPKVLRAAMGAVFRINLAKINSPAELADLPVFAGDMGGRNIREFTPPPAWALVIGRESGLTDMWQTAPKLTVPMSAGAESLNAAAAAAILMWELSDKC